MATVSPTPMPSSSFGLSRLQRQGSTRQPSSHSLSYRRQSPVAALAQSQGFSANAAPLQDISYGDSSDDDIPQPMNFSAITRALLEERPAVRDDSPPQDIRQAALAYRPARIDGIMQDASTTPSRGRLRISRRTSPDQAFDNANSPPKVVHLSGSRGSSGLRRTKSVMANYNSTGTDGTPLELITPAPRPRIRQTIPSRADSASSAHGRSDGPGSDARSNGLSGPGSQKSGDEEQPAHGSISQPRPRILPEGMPGSMRVKRVPVVSGTFLRGAPVRKRLIRRQSEDEENGQDLGASQNENVQTPYNDARQDDQNGDREQRAESGADWHAGQRSASRGNNSPTPGSSAHQRSSSQVKPSMPQAQPLYKVPVLPATLPSMHDQENEPPPTFKRNKIQTSTMLGAIDKISVQPDSKVSSMLVTAPKSLSPLRPILAPRSQNTPHRPPPPPPKMTVLETATATAGASTVKSKKKRSHVSVNGKMFTLMGKIGKGGSSEVYRVMAENYRMFALKKVSLEDVNEDAIRGFKGEIDLLKKLENVERVVRLLDWEVNEQKQSLSVLMEIGESDLNRVLSLRLHPENARFDISFTRHYWKEMLECVLAVHEQDIVHSDLKPANFLLVQGRLKLIDFGISSAIDTDNTVNVHRETNVGTPNYMSPESLQDTNQGQRGTVGPDGMILGKLMKLGKPSDIWSLGCILYQMAYGKPPFAHVANPYQRIMAIINPAVVIEYPATGIGGAPVPSCLRRTLRRCLNRDFTQRPTAEQLLDERDPFLNPDMENDGAVAMTEELLGQILAKVVERCRDPKRGLPSDAELATYPKGFFGKIRGRLEEV